jgi:hypothetical protein
VIPAAGGPSRRDDDDPQPAAAGRAITRRLVGTAATTTRRAIGRWPAAAKAVVDGFARHSEHLGQRPDRHAQIPEHGEIGVGAAAQGREVVAHDQGIDAGGHAHRLQLPEG